MRDLYGDDYETVAVSGDAALIPGGVQRIAGAAVFLGLVAGLGLWSYRLGTRDATEVPIIRAMEGPARVEPADPGGARAAHQGLEVNEVLAGAPAQIDTATVAAPADPLASEDAAQGELVLATPEAMAERVVAESGELAVPPEEPTDLLGGPAGVPPIDLLADGETALDDPADLAAPAAGPRPRNRPANLVVTHAKPAAVPTPEAPVMKVASTPAPVPAGAKPVSAKEATGLQRGTRLVQLGAFDSEAITRKAWDHLVAKNPDLLASKSLYIERTTANARVFYRLRVAGFTNTDQTREMCEALRARGIDCIPVTLQ
jgi:cell division septation protein DedD